MGQYKSRPATGSVQELWRDECRKAYRMVSDQMTCVSEHSGGDDGGETELADDWTRLHMYAFRGGTGGGGDGGDENSEGSDVPWDELAAEVKRAAKGTGLSALHIACTRSSPRHSAFVAELLRRGADPRAQCRKGFLPAHYAAANGCTDALAALVAAGSPSGGAHGITPLHMAAMRGNTAEVAVLLGAQGGSDPLLCAADDNGYV